MPLKTSLIKNLVFSGITVLAFFVLVEGSLHWAGVQPKYTYRSFELPLWVRGIDPVNVENYKRLLARLGRVNDDINAYQFDPDLEWMLKPAIRITVSNYSSAILIDKMPKWTIASNPAGFRVRKEECKDHEEYSNSIFLLGDSSSFGWGVEFGETYGAWLQERLNRKEDRKYALANYSIPGFSSFQGRLLIDRIKEIKPGDLVVVSFGWNDSYASMDSDRERFEKRRTLPGKINLGLNQFRTYRWIRSMLARWDWGEIPRHQHSKRRVALEDYQENLRYVFQGIRQKKGRPIFVNVCNEGEYFKVAERLSQSLNIPFFDFPVQMLPYLNRVIAGEIESEKYKAYWNSYGSLMEKDRLMTVLFPDRCHPNAIGHYLMGKIIFDQL